MRNEPCAVLVRVSTDEQDNARQRGELEAIAASRSWEVVEVIQEAGVSGSSRVRPGVARALELAESGKIKRLLVHEISRLSRRNSVLHDTMERLAECGVSIYWKAQDMETLLPSGEVNPAAALVMALLGETGRQERETLVRRTKSGLAQARRNGRTLGRPTGSGMGRHEILTKHQDVAKLLRQGLSVRKVAKLTDKASGTVMSVKRAMQ